MDIWLVEARYKEDRVSMTVGCCSTRHLAIEWVKEHGKAFVDGDTYYAVYRMIVDGGEDSLPLESNEYFDVDGNVLKIGE